MASSRSDRSTNRSEASTWVPPATGAPARRIPADQVGDRQTSKRFATAFNEAEEGKGAALLELLGYGHQLVKAVPDPGDGPLRPPGRPGALAEQVLFRGSGPELLQRMAGGGPEAVDPPPREPDLSLSYPFPRVVPLLRVSNVPLPETDT